MQKPLMEYMLIVCVIACVFLLVLMFGGCAYEETITVPVANTAVVHKYVDEENGVVCYYMEESFGIAMSCLYEKDDCDGF